MLGDSGYNTTDYRLHSLCRGEEGRGGVPTVIGLVYIAYTLTVKALGGLMHSGSTPVHRPCCHHHCMPPQSRYINWQLSRYINWQLSRYSTFNQLIHYHRRQANVHIHTAVFQGFHLESFRSSIVQYLGFTTGINIEDGFTASWDLVHDWWWAFFFFFSPSSLSLSLTHVRWQLPPNLITGFRRALLLRAAGIWALNICFSRPVPLSPYLFLFTLEPGWKSGTREGCEQFLTS